MCCMVTMFTCRLCGSFDNGELCDAVNGSSTWPSQKTWYNSSYAFSNGTEDSHTFIIVRNFRGSPGQNGYYFTY